MKCPKCNSDRFYYVHSVIEFCRVDIEDDKIKPGEFCGSSVNTNYGTHLYCAGCVSVFDLNLNEKHK
jgi:hypothetical protein